MRVASNVGGVPFNDHPHGFWLTLGLILLLSGLLARIVGSRRRRAFNGRGNAAEREK